MDIAGQNTPGYGGQKTGVIYGVEHKTYSRWFIDEHGEQPLM